MDRGLVEKLKDRGGIEIYKRQVFNRTEQTETKMFGWHTNTGTRAPILDGLATAIRKWDEEGDGIEITDIQVLLELETCIVKLNGRIEAMAGCHDDTVMMLAIGLATLDMATRMAHPRKFRHEAGDHDLPANLTYT